MIRIDDMQIEWLMNLDIEDTEMKNPQIKQQR